jgi:PadR family transcriptional regulator, regulatory protein PadR
MAILRQARLYGTLDALILKALKLSPRHGYAIARWLEQAADGALTIEDGSLYPALYRLERRGWIEADWGMSELGRRARFYRLTRAGRQQLVVETRDWAIFAAFVTRVLETA